MPQAKQPWEYEIAPCYSKKRHATHPSGDQHGPENIDHIRFNERNGS